MILFNFHIIKDKILGKKVMFYHLKFFTVATIVSPELNSFFKSFPFLEIKYD